MKERKLRTRPVILTGNYDPTFAAHVAEQLDMDVTPVEVTHFADGEIKARIEESVRGADVFVIQSHGAPVNTSIMEHLAIINAAHYGSAREITAVFPYRSYGRADRIAAPHESFMGKLAMDFFHSAGANRILEVDPHAGQSMGFFNGLYDTVPAAPAIRQYIQTRMQEIDGPVAIVSPDAGRAKLIRHYADALGNLPRAIVDKKRTDANQAEVATVIGDVEGMHCFMIDDMFDTGGTIIKGARALRELGAISVDILATHGIFSSPATEQLTRAHDSGIIDRIAVTDTLKLPAAMDPALIDQISITGLVARAIERIYNDESVSGYFNGETHR